jgi:hypothetical protein
VIQTYNKDLRGTVGFEEIIERVGSREEQDGRDFDWGCVGLFNLSFLCDKVVAGFVG